MNIPGCRLIRKCGGGAFGEVWIAEDASGRRVALKTVEKSAQSDRELSGLRAYVRIAENPHLIRVFHAGELPERLFYTMELADPLEEGGDASYRPATLANVLKLRGRLCAEATAFIARELLDGVAALHRAGLIHRDIKPENILYVNGTVKLSDIGLLRPLSRSLSLGGTLGFIPPERLAGSSGCRAPEDDLYALGKTLYCVWSGNPPEDFPAIPAALMDEPGARKLNAVINTACAETAAVRFHTAQEFLDSLETGVPKSKKLFALAFKLFRRPFAAAVFAALAVAAIVIMIGRGGQTKSDGVPASEKTAPPEFPAEISISDGTREGTVIYSFVENSRVSEGKPFDGRFTDPQYWRGFGLANVRREYKLVRWDPHARGTLELLPKLPREYRMTFDLELSGIPREFDFVFFPANRSRTVTFRIREEGGKPQLTALRGGAASGDVSAASLRPGNNRIGIVRTARGLKMSVNGEIAFEDLRLPHDERMFISANCGVNATVTLRNFRLSAGQEK